MIMVIFEDKMIRFIYACQDDETGGFSDRPGDMVRGGQGRKRGDRV